MAKYGIQILSNTGSFEIGFYPDEKVFESEDERNSFYDTYNF